jgi:outer membrane beta-barrel protein
MRRKCLKIGWISLMASLLVCFQWREVRAAETIDFPQDELAQESVLPKFDRPDSVKKRNVTTESKFELGTYYGWNILEPIQNQSKIGFNIGYHWNEESSFVVNYALWMGGLNKQYTDELYSSNKLDFDRSPKIKSSVFGHYEWKIFYGKISLTKQGVVNLSTYPIFGAGMTMYEHKNYPGVDFGIGQKFYFGKSFALRADFKLQYGQKPSPFLQGALKTPPLDGTAGSGQGDRIPAPGDFQDKWDLATVLDVGVSFLF